MGLEQRQNRREARAVKVARDIRILPGQSIEILPGKAAKKLGIPAASTGSWRITRRSLDARKKNDIHYSCTVELFEKGETMPVPSLLNLPNGKIPAEPEFRPLIVGFGPAGMFAGLLLARAGLCPLIIERGQKVDDRSVAVEKFRTAGILDTESNVQFGEGGAGTFSDGKLNTGTHDGRISAVLYEFYKHGAPESVLYDAKPHIGTDILSGVVKNIRNEIVSLGGEIHFCTKLDKLIINNGSVEGAEVTSPDGEYTIPCRELILATGHSARDTFEALLRSGVPMERKAFAMGVRIEHLQKDISLAQYGSFREALPPADYSLSLHLPSGEGVFTFCMCPGGNVIASASEAGMVCTNGMSFSMRDGVNANSALLTGVAPEVFPESGVLGGMYWQRDIERRAYEYGSAAGLYYAPAQRLEDFLSCRPSSGPGCVLPSYIPGVRWGDLRCVLPNIIADPISQAVPILGKKLCGFSSPDAVLTGPETRSSSPVRILRSKECMSAVNGLFPCGEGAGYAGGITSAAVDGVRCAEKVIEKYL